MLRILAVLLLLVVGGILFWFRESDKFLLSSPIPKVFGTDTKAKVNTWFPKDSPRRNFEDLYVSARGAIAVDYDSAEILFAKEPEMRLPIASTAKIMTALVALENADPLSVFTVSEAASAVGENSMGLTTGEKLQLKELLYGIMLVSGNDAAVAIAEGIAGSQSSFVSMMNDKVRELGLDDTHFVNATGLDEEGGNSHSTVYDMAVIAHYTWEKYELFRQITATVHHYIEATGTHRDFDLYNDTNLLTTYPGVLGIKPGFTWEAGLCLVTYAENEGKKIVAVILGSDDRRGEMKEILDYSFGKFGITVSHPALDL